MRSASIPIGEPLTRCETSMSPIKSMLGQFSSTKSHTIPRRKCDEDDCGRLITVSGRLLRSCGILPCDPDSFQLVDGSSSISLISKQSDYVLQAEPLIIQDFCIR